jgi:hypothetical protein
MKDSGRVTRLDRPMDMVETPRDCNVSSIQSSPVSARRTRQQRNDTSGSKLSQKKNSVANSQQRVSSQGVLPT